MNRQINILVIEDDNTINNLLYTLATNDGYKVHQAFSGTEALLYLNQSHFDLLLLDLNLPGLSGEELIEQVRLKWDMPILVISAKLEHNLKALILKMGADDFISKPFDLDEVSARIESHLRRYKGSLSLPTYDTLTYKDLLLNVDTKEITVNNIPVSLTAREFSILQLFMTYPKKIFSKSNLFESIWGDDFMSDENTVNVHISHLRSKLAKHSTSDDYIETIWGMGYRLK